MQIYFYKNKPLRYNHGVTLITARQRVLAFLGKQRSASAAQIGRALNMSSATVRHHLSVLQADGRISMIGALHKLGRGRPVKEYRLSEKSLGDNLGMLSDALLAEWLGKLSSAKSEQVLASVARNLADQIGRIDPNAPAAKRLAMLMEELNVRRYQAHWEAGRDGPRILFAHCPYTAIIEKHPELCRVDAIMLGEQLDARANQVSKIDLKPGGTAYCIFAVR